MRSNMAKAGSDGTEMFQKWRLLGAISTVLVLLSLAALALSPDVEGMRSIIRLTARTSLVLFCMAFIASPAWKLFPSRWTGWQLKNRRYLGLGFAVSHGIHAIAIVSFATLDPSGFQAASTGNPAAGIIAYAFIILMSATSFDRSAAWTGRLAWKILHTSGMYYIWLSFMITFGKRIPHSMWYVVPLVVLSCALALRAAAAVKSWRGRKGNAGLAR